MYFYREVYDGRSRECGGCNVQFKLVGRIGSAKVLLVSSVFLCVMAMQNFNGGVGHLYWWSAIGLASLGVFSDGHWGRCVVMLLAQ